ncbi:MAG: ABC transporter ATP-binding protein [Clostridia bacterium]|nr:ABC transporter ATP-binding protein [Clostridia bacterium]
MKMKPILFDRIQTNHTSFEVDFAIENNVTFIIGDSGTGKSAVYSFLQEMAAENKSILCFNYLDQKKGYKTSIKRSKEKLFIIDNADILLDDAMRWYIATDGKNQYILIGRNPTGLMLSQEDMMELDSSTADGKTKFSLKHAF